ncbi:MAG: hypothetical protein WC619_03805 [Patescibacteria group bacterium]
MWGMLIVVRVLTAYILFPITLKKTLERIKNLPTPRKVVLIIWQFLLCLSFSIALAIVAKITGFGRLDWQFNYLWAVVAILGVFNAYACYCQWRAMDTNLSKTAIGTQLDDAIAIALGYFFLGEKKFFGFQLVAGIALCFAAGFILIGFKAGEENSANRRLAKNVLKYSVIWGVAGAAQRFFNLEGLPIFNFLVCWYGGSAIGALLIHLFGKIVKKEKVSFWLDEEDKKKLPAVAFFVWVSLVLGYLIANHVRISIYQPIFLVSEAVLMAFIGLYYFHEKKEMKTREWAAIAIGLAGVMIVGTSY